MSGSPEPERAPGAGRRWLRLLPPIMLLALLCIPGAAWIAGARQPLLESRPKEEFPAINRSSLRDEHTFRRIDTAVLDRLPGRGQALDVHARIGIDLFRDSTNPDVAIGSNGYLYYVPELGACREGTRPGSDTADAVDVLAGALMASGRNTTVMMPRSKLFIRGDDAPEIDAEEERCVDELEQAIAQRLDRIPGGLSLAADLEASEAAGEPTFLMRDTHWNWRGRELFARRVLDRIRPGLAEQADLRAERESDHEQPDLDTMLGRSRKERDRIVEARRTPPDPLPAGDVLLVGDSQLELALTAPRGGGPSIRDIALPGQPSCNWLELIDGACDDALRRARVVVIEKVARDAALMAGVCWRPIAVAAADLRGAPARWERTDGGRPAAGGTLAVPATGRIATRVRIEGNDLDPRTPRLLRIPVETVAAGADGVPVPLALIQTPQAGPPAPCATPTQAEAGGALFLPVPAGRRASDLVMRLEGSPGTRIGVPEVVALDGRRPAGRG